MRSLHNIAVSKVFKFEDFTEDEQDSPETGGGPVPEEAYLTFSDEDLYFKPEIPAEEEEAPPEEDPEGFEEETGHAEPEAPEDPAVAIAAGIIDEAEQRAKTILSTAGEASERIMSEAERKVAGMYSEAEEEGHKKGYEEGFSAGSEEGKSQALRQSEEKLEAFFKAIDAACRSIETSKQEILDRNLADLCELTLAIAEKIVCIALDSSGEVVKRMILSAAAPAETTQWAKVTISDKDVEMMKEDGIDIYSELYSISDKIDIIAADGADRGTCFIEFPDHVIDAGTGTQLRNIKDLIHSADRE